MTYSVRWGTTMTTEELNNNTGIQDPKPLGMMGLIFSKWRKPKFKETKPLLAATKPWQNLAAQVELPSRRWLEDAKTGSDLPN